MLSRYRTRQLARDHCVHEVKRLHPMQPIMVIHLHACRELPTGLIKCMNTPMQSHTPPSAACIAQACSKEGHVRTCLHAAYLHMYRIYNSLPPGYRHACPRTDHMHISPCIHHMHFIPLPCNMLMEHVAACLVDVTASGLGQCIWVNICQWPLTHTYYTLG